MIKKSLRKRFGLPPSSGSLAQDVAQYIVVFFFESVCLIAPRHRYREMHKKRETILQKIKQCHFDFGETQTNVNHKNIVKSFRFSVQHLLLSVSYVAPFSDSFFPIQIRHSSEHLIANNRRRSSFSEVWIPSQRWPDYVDYQNLCSAIPRTRSCSARRAASSLGQRAGDESA